MIKTFQNPEGQKNPIDGSKVMVILLFLLFTILLIGGASAVEGLQTTGPVRFKNAKDQTCNSV